MVKNPTVLDDAAHADWAAYNDLTAAGWSYHRATTFWGKAYWWLVRGQTHRLLASPLRGVDASHLMEMAERLGLPLTDEGKAIAAGEVE